MPAYTYKVIPFRAHVKSSDDPTAMAKQLEDAIAEHAVDGYEFFQVATVTMEVAPGCLNLGGQSTAATYDQLVFRRPAGAP